MQADSSYGLAGIIEDFNLRSSVIALLFGLIEKLIWHGVAQIRCEKRVYGALPGFSSGAHLVGDSAKVLTGAGVYLHLGVLLDE